MSDRATPHVAIVLPYLKARGTEKQALLLSAGLVERGWRVSLVLVQGWGEPWLYEEFRRIGVEVHNLQPAWQRSIKGVAWWRLPALVRCLRQCDPDVVLSGALLANRMTGAASAVLRRPFVAIYSGGIRPQPQPTGIAAFPPIRSLLEGIWRLRQGWPRHLITVSELSLVHLRQRFPDTRTWTSAISNGVRLPATPQSPVTSLPIGQRPASLKLVFVGALELERKGIDLLLQAVQSLKQDGRLAFSLQLVGAGPDEAGIQQMIQQGGLESCVQLLGEQSDPERFLQKADLFVLPSRREGLPNVLLEAMACGVCVLAANCPVGPAEVIRHGENGWLVPVNDADALAEAIARLLSDDGLRHRLASGGFRHVSTVYTPARMHQAYDRLLRPLAAGRRR